MEVLFMPHPIARPPARPLPLLDFGICFSHQPNFLSGGSPVNLVGEVRSLSDLQQAVWV